MRAIILVLFAVLSVSYGAVYNVSLIGICPFPGATACLTTATLQCDPTCTPISSLPPPPLVYNGDQVNFINNGLSTFQLHQVDLTNPSTPVLIPGLASSPIAPGGVFTYTVNIADFPTGTLFYTDVLYPQSYGTILYNPVPSPTFTPTPSFTFTPTLTASATPSTTPGSFNIALNTQICFTTDGVHGTYFTLVSPVNTYLVVNVTDTVSCNYLYFSTATTQPNNNFRPHRAIFHNLNCNSPTRLLRIPPFPFPTPLYFGVHAQHWKVPGAACLTITDQVAQTNTFNFIFAGVGSLLH